MSRRTINCPVCYQPVIVDDDLWLNGTPELRAHLKVCGWPKRKDDDR